MDYAKFNRFLKSKFKEFGYNTNSFRTKDGDDESITFKTSISINTENEFGKQYINSTGQFTGRLQLLPTCSVKVKYMIHDCKVIISFGRFCMLTVLEYPANIPALVDKIKVEALALLKCNEPVIEVILINK